MRNMVAQLENERAENEEIWRMQVEEIKMLVGT
jgi:hypothetical protein